MKSEKSYFKFLIILLLLGSCNDKEKHSRAFFNSVRIVAFFDIPSIEAKDYSSVRIFDIDIRMKQSQPSNGYYSYYIPNEGVIPSNCDLSIDFSKDDFIYSFSGDISRVGNALPIDFFGDPGLWEESLNLEVYIEGSYRDSGISNENAVQVKKAYMRFSNSQMFDEYDITEYLFSYKNDSSTAQRLGGVTTYVSEFYLSDIGGGIPNIYDTHSIEAQIAFVVDDIHGTEYKH